MARESHCVAVVWFIHNGSELRSSSLAVLSEAFELQIQGRVAISPKLYPSLKLILTSYEHRKTFTFERGEVARMLRWEFVSVHIAFIH